MKVATGQWLEIFRAGHYGKKGSYSAADLDKIVSNFTGNVPIVIGHPERDAPARGWLDGVKRSGDVLLGRVGAMDTSFARDLAESKYRNRSIRLLKTDFGPKLLHLGFLGAVLPEVAGLRATASFSGQADRLDFGFRSGCDLAYKV